MAAPAADISRRVYSREELSSHGEGSQLLMAIDGFVYDVTTFRNLHPGGKDVMAPYFGKDATDEFHAFHAPEAINTGESFIVGQLAKDFDVAASEATAAVHDAACDSDKNDNPETANDNIDGEGKNATDKGGGDDWLTSIGTDASAKAGGVQQSMSAARMSLIVDGSSSTDAKGTFTTTRCTKDELHSLPSIEDLANEATRRGAPALVSGYINYGSEDEESITANRSGFNRYTLRPHVCNDVGVMDLTTTILGGRIQLDFPVCVAPFAGSKITHPDGECAVAAAATTVGTAYCAPFYCGYTLEEVAQAAQAAPGPNSAQLMIQLYPARLAGDESNGFDGGLDREHMTKAIAYAKRLGYKASLATLRNNLETLSKDCTSFICTNIVPQQAMITVDTVNNGNRIKTYKNPAWIKRIIKECGGFPSTRGYTNADVPKLLGHSARITWDDVRWLKKEAHKALEGGNHDDLGMALLVKGILTAEDAATAAALGVDGVVVSNHGGRQLDGTSGTIECVEECVAAVQGRCEVFVDGGFRRGKDVVKALALGAKAVFIGRPVLWGLCLAGDTGVMHALSLFREEIKTVMQLCGCAKVTDINRSNVADKCALVASGRHHDGAVTPFALGALVGILLGMGVAKLTRL